MTPGFFFFFFSYCRKCRRQGGREARDATRECRKYQWCRKEWPSGRVPTTTTTTAGPRPRVAKEAGLLHPQDRPDDPQQPVLLDEQPVPVAPVQGQVVVRQLGPLAGRGVGGRRGPGPAVVGLCYDRGAEEERTEAARARHSRGWAVAGQLAVPAVRPRRGHWRVACSQGE